LIDDNAFESIRISVCFARHHFLHIDYNNVKMMMRQISAHG